METDTFYMILAVVLLIIGIVLALFGRAVWASLLVVLGSIIGWMLGFAVGTLFFGFDSFFGIIIIIILAFLGSFIMGAIFRFLVEAALALLTGLLVGAVAFFLAGIIVAVIVFAVVFILAFMFIEKVVVVVTALIGSLLAAAGVYYLLDRDPNYAVLAFLGLFVLGILVQYFALEGRDNLQEQSY